MINRTFLNANELERWADQNNASFELPRLVRKLIFATVAQITEISFPSDEAVLLGGWDGKLDAPEGNAYVPAGVSVWEMGRNEDVTKKANEDYRKRTEKPNNVVPASCEFVFVTPRRWPAKEKWLEERNAENVWKKVRAYDADDLIPWLEDAPSVHIWLSTHLGTRPEGVTDLNVWWNEWAEATDPPLSPAFMLAGRGDFATSVAVWLQRPASALAIAADTRDEASAVLCSVIRELPAKDREPLMARALVVHDAAVWQRLIIVRQPMVLVPLFDNPGNVTTAIKSGHHTLIPMARVDEALPMVQSLPKLRLEPVSQELQALNLPPERASELAAVARRSLGALRRLLAANHIQRPPWATASEALPLLPAILLGKWNDTKTADRQAVEAVAGTSYSDLTNTVVRCETEPDPPIVRQGDGWYVTAKEDAWRLMAGYAHADLVARFEQVAIEVLSELDPAFMLPPEQRLTAPLHGKALAHSKDLRNGIADTVALVSGLGQNVRLSGTLKGQDIGNRVVRAVLTSSTEWKLWASVGDDLPLLAEAAPDEFLAAVEAALKGTPDEMAQLMSDYQGGQFGGTLHAGLLWALENIAWEPTLLSRVTMILGDLSALDPNPTSNRVNRPLASLRDIFLTWRPQTTAGADQRMRILKALVARKSDVGWSVLQAILPNSHTMVINNHKPTYRTWAPDELPMAKTGEVWQISGEVVNLMLANAGTNGDRWAALVSALEEVPGDIRKTIITGLRSLSTVNLVPGTETALRATLRDIMARHRSMPDAQWAISSDVLDELDQIYSAIQVVDPIEANRWLFSHNPLLPNVDMDDWDELQKETAKQRIEAIASLYQSVGLPGIFALSEQVDVPGTVGEALARITLSDEEEAALFAELSSDNRQRRAASQVFVIIRNAERGWDWTKSIWAAYEAAWSTDQKASYLLSLPAESQTWELTEEAGPEVVAAYWSRAHPQRIDVDADIASAVGHLVEAKRPFVAVEVISRHLRDGAVPVPATMIADAIAGFAGAQPEPDMQWSSFAYWLAKLFDLLDASPDIPKEQLASLEWLCMPILDRTRKPKLLANELSTNPSFFVEMVSLVYRKRGEDKQVEPTDEMKSRAELAFTLLQSWSIVPGLQDNETIDGKTLSEWVELARSQAAEARRAEAADSHIGQVLAFSPPGTDGIRPAEPVRELMETILSERLESGLFTQMINSRGYTSRNPFEGGDQERILAADFLAKSEALADTWPRTALIYRKLAQAYERQAENEDAEANILEDFGG